MANDIDNLGCETDEHVCKVVPFSPAQRAFDRDLSPFFVWLVVVFCGLSYYGLYRLVMWWWS